MPEQLQAIPYKELIERFGEPFVRQRLLQQALLEAKILRQRGGMPKWLKDPKVVFFLKCTGLYALGMRNCFKLEITENDLFFPDLPKKLDGVRVLHLSDLHLDFTPGLEQVIAGAIRTLEYDFCVLTGDYRTKEIKDYGAALEMLAVVASEMKGPAYGVLGNHDLLEMLPGMEAMGIQMLVNETSCFEKKGEKIHIMGTDDSNFYSTHNLNKTAEAIPAEEFSILLTHYPKLYKQALMYHCNLMLSGHTHGGQICLPGRVPILSSRCPRKIISGYSSTGHLQMYTHRGTGSCTLPIRFFCPPEIAIHTLRVGTKKGYCRTKQTPYSVEK